jgi:hypothetical protein
LIFHVIVLSSFFIHLIFSSFLWVSVLLAHTVGIFRPLMNRVGFCFFALFELIGFRLYSSPWGGKHIIIISLWIANIVDMHTLYCGLGSYWAIQILIIIYFSLVITCWNRRLQVWSYIWDILDSFLQLVLVRIKVLALVNRGIDSALILFREMFRA